MSDRPYWCEICARKKECYGITLKPKCFVPTADRKTEPQLTPNYCGTCKHREVPCGELPCDVCHDYSNYEPKTEPQTDCVKVGKWYSFTDYVVEMQGDNKPNEFRIVPQTERSE